MNLFSYVKIDEKHQDPQDEPKHGFVLLFFIAKARTG